jgi:hypothetical protein
VPDARGRRTAPTAGRRRKRQTTVGESGSCRYGSSLNGGRSARGSRPHSRCETRTTTSPGAASTYVVHEDPAKRRASNYIAHLDLAPFDLGGQFEQVWPHELGNDMYALACIPFMPYGLALGDEASCSLSPERKSAGLRADDWLTCSMASTIVTR